MILTHLFIFNSVGIVISFFMAMEAVAGGYNDDHTIFDTFVEWLIQLPTHYPEETPDDDRPLTFPQDRRGLMA